MSFETNLNPTVGVDDYRHRIGVVQGLIQDVLALVHLPFFIGNALATPGATQCVGRVSNRQCVYDWDISDDTSHKQPPKDEISNSTTPFLLMPPKAGLCVIPGADIMSLA